MPISLFDLDNTLLSANSSFSFCLYLYKKKILSLRSLFFSCSYYIRHKYLGLSLDKLHEKVFKKMLYGMSLPLLEKHAKDFVSEYFEKILYFPAVERLRFAQQMGHYTCILSNSPSFLVCILAKKFCVDAWKASEYLVDKDLKLCQIQDVFQGREKALFVEEITEKLKIPKEMSVGYSDSYLDLPFLYSVGKAVVVNPDSRLKQVADHLGWEKI